MEPKKAKEEGYFSRSLPHPEPMTKRLWLVVED